MCGNGLPVFTTGRVSFQKQTSKTKSRKREEGVFGTNRFLLQIEIEDEIEAPKAGQFFMLRKKGSNRLLGRPISVYSYIEKKQIKAIYFLITERGEGTKELVSLKKGDLVDILGPLGDSFPLPKSTDKVCLIGGGIGIAPIVNLATTINGERMYDVYACFKDRSYDLSIVPEQHLTIATEDGSKGTKGTLTSIIDAKTLKEKGYTVVYACGPTSMLKYVQSICQEAKVQSYLSMENRMACGVGACLGCTIKTTIGNKRCCKDGPVFPGNILIFADDEPEVRTSNTRTKKQNKPDLSVEIAGVVLKNPVIAASGTFGYGVEYKNLVDPEVLGGICSKGLTLEPRNGNDGIRIHEISHVGLMNSIGLENPGINHFIEHELPSMLKIDTVKIANLSGSDIDSYVAGAKLLNRTDIDMIELNISCPNVKAGGMAFGMTPVEAEKVTSAVRAATRKPLIVKLTPNAPDLVGVALAVKTAGADAISLVNTFQALAIDISLGKPVFDNICAGYSGPGIKPIALRMVYDVSKAIKATDPDFPIIGLGGITTWQDAVEFIMAGASAIQVGTATFGNPDTMSSIIDGIRTYMEQMNYKTIADFRGAIL